MKQGQYLLNRAGSWQTGGIKTTQSKEDWLQGRRKRQDPAAIPAGHQHTSLSQEGLAPLSNNHLFMTEAVHGPAGPWQESLPPRTKAYGRMAAWAVQPYSSITTLPTDSPAPLQLSSLP